MPRDRSMTDGCKPSTSTDAPSTSAPQRRATATGIPASPPPVPDPVDTERHSYHDKGRFVASSSEEDLAQQCTENLEIERVASVEC